MPRASFILTALLVSFLAAALTFAQSTIPGDEIDIEIFNQADGSNDFLVAPGDSFWAYVWLSPSVTDSFECSESHGCAGSVMGGKGNLAAAAVDVAFDPAMLQYLQMESNPGTAAVDGLAQEQNLGEGRIGWALAGDWEPVDADPSQGLESPCDMGKISAADWVFRVQFQALQEGGSALVLRRQSDNPAFELSFADVCGSPTFKLGSGVDEVVNASVTVFFADSIFADGFESGTTSAW